MRTGHFGSISELVASGRRLGVAVAVLTALAGLGSAGHAATGRAGSVSTAGLIAPMPASGDVSAIHISRDGASVLYVADQDTDEAGELFRVPVDAGARPVRLSAPVPAGSTVSEVMFGGDRVVYVAGPADAPVADLYSVPLAGGTASRLNGGADVEQVTIAPDASRVLYVSDEGNLGHHELFSVPIGGGRAVKLNGALAAGCVHVFAITPDGARVVYVARQESSAVTDLYIVPIAGGAATKLSGTTPAGTSICCLQMSADGSRVVFMVDQGTDDIYDLYSVRLAHAAVTRLNPDPVAAGSVVRFAISADGGRVVYLADQDTDEVQELYSVPIDGGRAVKLNVDADAYGNVTDFALTPDGARAVYETILWDEARWTSTSQIFSVPVGGGESTRLNGALTGGTGVFRFAIGPDGTRVVFVSEQDGEGRLALYSVSIRGGRVVKLNGEMPPDSDVLSWDFLVSPDGRRVIYHAAQDAPTVMELYSVPIAGGQVTRLNDTPVEGGDVRFAPRPAVSDRCVAYAGDLRTDEVIELFAACEGSELDPTRYVVLPLVARQGG